MLVLPSKQIIPEHVPVISFSFMSEHLYARIAALHGHVSGSMN